MTRDLTPDLEVKLGSWLADRAPAPTPPEFVERILAIPRTTPVDDRRGLRVIDGNRRRLLLLVAASLTSLGVVGGGLILAGVQQHEDTRPPTVRASSVVPPSASEIPPASADPSVPAADTGPVIPTVVGAGIENGAVETSFGRARWVHWQGDATTFPDPIPQIAPDGRFVWYRNGRSGWECTPDSPELRCTDMSPRLWVSDGLLTERRSIPLPTADADAVFWKSEDRFWFLSSHPVGIWWTTDLATWQSGDISAISSPGADIPWKVSFALPAVIAGTPAVWARFSAADPGALLGHPGESVGLEADGRGGYVARRYRRRSQGGDQDLGAITVREQAGGIRFVDAHHREVGRVDGVGMSFVDAWLRRHEIVEQQLFALEDDRWRPVDLALGHNAAPGIIDGGENGAVALASDEDGAVHLFRSADGRTWTGGAALVADDGVPLVSDDLWVDDRDGVKTYIVNRDGTTRWASADAEHWTLGPFPEGPVGMRVPGGWVKTPDQSDDGVWQVSRDGLTWLPVPELSTVTTKIAPNGGGGSSESLVADAIWFTVEEDQTPYTRDVWVVEFDAPPN